MGSVQIRNVPDDVHRKLRARAALRGQSLSEYALTELRRAIERPTVEEVVDRVRRLTTVDVGESGADAVRAERTAQ